MLSTTKIRGSEGLVLSWIQLKRKRGFSLLRGRYVSSGSLRSLFRICKANRRSKSLREWDCATANLRRLVNEEGWESRKPRLDDEDTPATFPA